MKTPHRWILVGLLVVLGAFAAYGCKDKKKNPMAPGPTADVTINITGQNGATSYQPNPANVTVGQTVAWKNIDSMIHTATQDGGGFDTGDVSPGLTSGLFTITTAGDLPYRCSRHPGTMTGTLHVVP